LVLRTARDCRPDGDGDEAGTGVNGFKPARRGQVGENISAGHPVVGRPCLLAMSPYAAIAGIHTEFRKLVSLDGHNPVHRDVVPPWMNGWDALHLVADAYDQRLFRQRGERPVEEAAAIAEAVVSGVDADHRGDDDIGDDRAAIGWDRNIPDAF